MLVALAQVLDALDVQQCVGLLVYLVQLRIAAEDQSVFDDILPEVTVALQEALEKGSDTYGMQQAMRRVVGRWASRKLRRSPMIMPRLLLSSVVCAPRRRAGVHRGACAALG